MDSVNGGGVLSKQLTPESMPLLAEGISLILSRWTGFLLVLSEERYPHQKLEQFSADIFSWFTKSKEKVLYFDDLENMLEESISLSFEWGLQDDDIEEVAYNLMVIHEECLLGKCDSIEKLRKSSTGAEAASQSIQVINEEDDASSGDEATNMVVGDQNPRKTVEAEDMVNVLKCGFK